MSGMYIYTQGPPPGTSEKFANSEKLSFPRSMLGMGAERSQTCGVPPFMASPSRRVLNSLPLVSSDTLTPLVHCIHKLHTCNPKIVQTYCAVSRLAAQSLDSENATLSLCKFLDCVEHKHDITLFWYKWCSWIHSPYTRGTVCIYSYHLSTCIYLSRYTWSYSIHVYTEGFLASYATSLPHCS